MEPISPDTIELGNLLFGNSRGHFSMPRDKWQDEILEFLEKCGFDSYGHFKASDPTWFGLKDDQINTYNLVKVENGSGVENDIFCIRPYYWGDDETIASLPNFVFKPEGIEISWYKYPLRDSYCSHDIDFDKFKEILKTCEESLTK